MSFDLGETAVDELTAHGVAFERHDGSDQDEKGIFRAEGPDSAPCRESAENVLSVSAVEADG